MRTSRRAVLAGAVLAAGGVRALAQDARPPSAWEAWKARHLAPDGRVVDDVQAGVSHSEGQSYGMHLALAHRDDAAFDAMLDWTRAHLAVRRDPLLAWRWQAGEPDGERDWNNATDGDLLHAWALLRMARLRRDEAMAARAGEMARGLDEICLARDPRGSGLLLLPAAEGFQERETVTVNPSYLIPAALEDLAAAFRRPRLTQAARDGEALLAELAAAGLVPDWIVVSPDGWRPRELGAASSRGLETIRVPLWLVRSGRAAHPAVLRAATDLRPDRPGYAAVQALARAATAPIEAPLPAPPTDPAAVEPYYPATLHLLAMDAAQVAGLPVS